MHDRHLIRDGVRLGSSPGPSPEIIAPAASCWTWTQIWIAFQSDCHAARVTLAHLNLLQMTVGLR